MRYDWILFDADDTLFHFDAFAGLKRMFASFGVHFDEQAFVQYQTQNQPLWVAYQNGDISAAELRHRRFVPWAERLAVTTEHLNEAFMSTMVEVCTLLPGASELIASLQGKARLGIITNGFASMQQARLQRAGWEHAFSPLVVSEEVGVAKPHAGIFEHALDLMGNPERDRVLMVGDNPHSDILGGLNAGLHTCWLNTLGAPTPEGITPHHQVTSLGQLQEWLLEA
ncbi:pyrimidine 5'-nucleotidase [Oceanimonas sp. CHS3-5]|uniref:pyrimidine 5'-nucleotidase n=1 Tax=Oceanimonas sp. CHS3-5 TaxID=3068186 RepID=UPI00273DC645|nr:pyrimidine 5'-nucleotidase [Oceanimonas sp. CHS3-5]MDP5293285.1 pyrimidine 5'-nucleotidase [Oceanimonas sp. CHS3-5]